MAGKTFAAKTKRNATKAPSAGQRSKTKASSRSLDPKSSHAKAGPAPVFSGVQTKVKIGKAGDRYEREADAVAESVVGNRPAPAINRVGGGGPVNRMEKKDEPEAQRAPEKEEKEAQRAPDKDKEAQRLPEQEDQKAQRAPEKEDEKAQRAPEKEEEKAQRAPEKEEEKAQRAPEKEEEQAQRAPDQEEEKAQRASEKEEEKAQRAPEKEEEQAQRAPEKEEEQAQRAPEKEEEQAQRAPEKEEENAQRAPEKEEEQAQRAPAEDDQKAQCKGKEEETAQAKDSPAAQGGSQAMRAAATHAISFRGAGQSLPVTVRGRLESSLGRDLKDVKIHTGAEAEKANKVLHAKAFTHGKHIWLGHGQSPHDLRLMAHEVTHVVQQTGKVRRTTDSPAKDDKNFSDPKLGTITNNGGTYDIAIATLTVPGFKATFNEGADILPKGTAAPEPTAKWKAAIDKAKLADAVKAKYTATGLPTLLDNGKDLYTFKRKGTKEIVKGSLDELAEQMVVPKWGRSGAVVTYQVDHKKYFLLGGHDAIYNLWLVEGGIKKAADEAIAKEIDRAVQALIDAATPKMATAPTLDKARSQKIRVFAIGSGAPGTVSADQTYSQADIETNQLQLKGLEGLTLDELEELGSQTFSDPNLGTVIRVGRAYEVEVFKLPLPGFKADRISKAIIKKDDARNTKQAANWDKAINAQSSAIESALKTKYTAESGKVVKKAGKDTYWFKIKTSGEVFSGTLTEIRGRTRVPNWSRSGSVTNYNIDHIREIQLGGADDETNYWLLESGINQAAGRDILASKKKAVEDLLKAAKPTMPKAPTYDEARKKDIEVTGFTKTAPATVSTDNYYELPEIRDAHAELQGLQSMTDAEITAYDPAKAKSNLTINYTAAGAAQTFTVPIAGSPSSATTPITLGTNLVIGNAEFDRLWFDPSPNSVKSGQIFGKANIPPTAAPLTSKQQKKLELEFTLFKVRGQDNSVYMEETTLTSKVQDILDEAKGWSPVKIKRAELVPNKGLSISGVVEVSLPILKGSTIDFTIEGNNLTLSKTFTAGEFKLPGPVKFTDGSLTAFAGTTGIGAEGTLNYTIEKFGKGSLIGKATVANGLDIEGNFKPDTDAVVAEGKVYYRNAKLGGSLDVTVPEGKISGIKSAGLKVTVEDGVITGTGEIVPKIKAINKGTLTAKYQEGKGLEIGAKIDMAGAHKAITSGSVEGQVKQTDSGWSLKAAGELGFAVATLTGTIKAEFEDGGFTAVADIDYKRKLVDGKVSVGVTNRAVDPVSGTPGGPGTDDFTIFGSGTVGIQFTPWLKGTIGLKLKPDGQIIVSGEVALPSSYEVFPEKKINKNIFSIGLDIPIVGVAVAGQRIGIFATINGGLDAEAGIGPGKLVDTKIGVTYNPDDEDATKVTGSAKFQVPASAGLRLFVNGGLGAGIPVVSATAGLEIGGKLGLKGLAEAEANVEWTPSAGIELKATGSVKISPSFLFDITGFCKVEANLLLKKIELYNKRWKLGGFEYGSGLELGLTFPITYKQGEEFNPSFEQVKLTYPKIEAGPLLKDLAKKVFG